MNMLAFKVGLKTLVSRAGFFLKRNAPRICTTLGVAGFIGTAVTTGTAAVKTKEIMDERDRRPPSRWPKPSPRPYCWVSPPVR